MKPVPDLKDANEDLNCGNLRKIQESEASSHKGGRNGRLEEKMRLKSL